MNKIICIYHDEDMDGIASAAIVSTKFKNLKLIPYSYGHDLDTSECKDSEVFLVDLVLKTELMKEIDAISKSFTVIDHHRNALEKLKKEEFEKLLIIDSQKKEGACSIVWRHFYPKKEIPLIIKHISDYDVWNLEDEYTIFIAESFKANFDKNNNPLKFASKFLTRKALEKDRQQILCSEKIVDGSQIYFLLKRVILENVKYSLVEININKRKGAFINSGRISSYYVQDFLEKNGYEFFATYIRTKNKKWKYSLRSIKDDLDVSEIARSFGGNGHPMAAGFESDHFINLENFITL